MLCAHQGTGGHEVMLLGSLLHQVFEQVSSRVDVAFDTTECSLGFGEFPWKQ